MNAKIENGKLVLTLPLQTPTPSATGKTLVVASTHGNTKTDAIVEFNGNKFPVTVGCNAYIKPA